MIYQIHHLKNARRNRENYSAIKCHHERRQLPQNVHRVFVVVVVVVVMAEAKLIKIFRR